MDPVSGGPCQVIRSLIQSSEGVGILWEVISLDDPSSPFLRSYPFVIHGIGPARSPWQYSIKLFPWLVKNLMRFDVIIVNGIWLYHAYAAAKAFQLVRRRKIKTKNEQ